MYGPFVFASVMFRPGTCVEILGNRNVVGERATGATIHEAGSDKWPARISPNRARLTVHILFFPLPDTRPAVREGALSLPGLQHAVVHARYIKVRVSVDGSE